MKVKLLHYGMCIGAVCLYFAFILRALVMDIEDGVVCCKYELHIFCDWVMMEFVYGSFSAMNGFDF